MGLRGRSSPVESRLDSVGTQLPLEIVLASEAILCVAGLKLHRGNIFMRAGLDTQVLT